MTISNISVLNTLIVCIFVLCIYGCKAQNDALNVKLPSNEEEKIKYGTDYSELDSAAFFDLIISQQTIEYKNFESIQHIYFDFDSTLTHFPEIMSKCRNLSSLRIRNCPKVKNWDRLFEILEKGNIQLHNLSINECRLTEVPRGMASLNTFGGYRGIHLNLSGNSIKEIPDFLGELDDLYYLTFSNNDIRQFNAKISNNEYVENIYLDNNPHFDFQSLANALENCKGVENISLRSCGIQSLPYNFGKLAQVKEINLHGNPILENPPNDLCPLKDAPNVRILNLLKNIAYLPECLENGNINLMPHGHQFVPVDSIEVYQAKQSEFLKNYAKWAYKPSQIEKLYDVKGSDLIRYKEELKKCNRLKILSFSSVSQELEELLVIISNLDSLNALELEGVQDNLPDILEGFPQLDRLLLTKSNIKSLPKSINN